MSSPTQTTFPEYQGNDLGLKYSQSASVFKVWAPTAEAMKLHFYDKGTDGTRIKTFSMEKSGVGVWQREVAGDLQGQFYTYQSTIDGNEKQEVTDPYAIAVGVNGERAAVIDLRKTDPIDWKNDKKPSQKSFTDIVIYELHIRDLSSHPKSGIKNKGTFLGLTEKGTRGPSLIKTGLDHLVDLGVTHLHILPAFDYASIDETHVGQQYNWGYDPKNYNVPEGSYATDPYTPETRVKEFKEMVKALHQAGISVVMDVVYNHTSGLENSNFSQLVPDYYYRKNKEGKFSNASACGNEIASEMPMVNKFIKESVLHWIREYHVDGFRFDLMGIHDIKLMNEIRDEVNKIDPSIFIYGEGWTASSSPLPDSVRALKANTYKMPGIAAFCDEMRDGIKGHWSNHKDKGFVSGKPKMEESIKFGIVGAIQHKDIDYKKVNYSKNAWADSPSQCINYVSCHDDMTLLDKLAISNPDVSEEELKKRQILSNTIVMTSQGVPFLHAGVDFLNTKNGISNSYKSPDSVNWLDWDRKAKYLAIHEFYKNLIALRKAHPAFRMTSKEMINKHLNFVNLKEENTIAYKISGNANGDEWKEIFVIFNGSNENLNYKLEESQWLRALEGQNIELEPVTVIKESLLIKSFSAVILAQK